MKRKLKTGSNPLRGGAIRGSEGFTLIELVMVILLIGILAAVVLPKFINLTGQANTAASQGVVGSLGEGITTQLSQNLINNNLSTYVTVTGAQVVTFQPTLSGVNAAGTNPYANAFLLLPNYSAAATNAKASGTSYGYGDPTVPVATGIDLSNSWWLHYNPTVVKGPGTVAPLTAGFTCDNSAVKNPLYVLPTTTVPVGEYIKQIGNIDYVYSNGSTEDSYVYYMVIDASNNIDGFYLVPCQS